MKRPVLSLACCLVLLGNGVVQAQTRSSQSVEERAEEIINTCGATYGFPGAVSDCVRVAERREGKKLETAYSSALASTPGAVESLRASQRAWLTYQEKFCDAVNTASAVEGPGIGEVSRARCLLLTTMIRSSELAQFAGSID